MFSSADLLIHNVLVLGAALVLTFFAAFVCSRLSVRVIGPLLRRVDDSGALYEQWSGRISRIIVLVTTLLGLLQLGGAVGLSWYEIDASALLDRFIEPSLLRDPVAIAVLLGKLLGVFAAALALYFGLRSVVPVASRRLGALPGFTERGEQIELLLGRVLITLRWALLLGAVLVAVQLVTEAPAIREPVAGLAYVVVGISVARSIVAAAHLVVDVMFELSEALGQRQTPLRYFGRLQRLAGVTKRVLDYFVYVGTATLIIDQLTPDTPLAEFGRVVIRVIAILYVGRVIVEMCEVGVRESLAASSYASEAEQQQRQTLAPIATSLIRYAIYIVSIAMALSELGLDTSPLLAAAGLLGIAIGLGAQAIVSDLVSGFFILFEGMFLVGHRVTVGGITGTVEEIGVRVTKIRDELGVLHSIPNGEIRGVASHSQRFVNAIVEFGVPYAEDLPRVIAALTAHLASARSGLPDILADGEFVVAELRESCVWMRVVTRVKPGQDDAMSEALRIEVVAALAAAKIAPPHAYRVIEVQPPLQGIER
jgi:small-conductance mechanosensitive channel